MKYSLIKFHRLFLFEHNLLKLFIRRLKTFVAFSWKKSIFNPGLICNRSKVWHRFYIEEAFTWCGFQNNMKYINTLVVITSQKSLFLFCRKFRLCVGRFGNTIILTPPAAFFGHTSMSQFPRNTKTSLISTIQNPFMPLSHFSNASVVFRVLEKCSFAAWIWKEVMLHNHENFSRNAI